MRGGYILRGAPKVAMSDAFGIRGTISRLPNRWTRHGKLILELLTYDRQEDFGVEGVDLAVRFVRLADLGFGGLGSARSCDSSSGHGPHDGLE